MTRDEKPDADAQFEKVKEGLSPDKKSSYAPAGEGEDVKEKAETCGARSVRIGDERLTAERSPRVAVRVATQAPALLTILVAVRAAISGAWAAGYVEGWTSRGSRRLPPASIREYTTVAVRPTHCLA
jgi:hypothetical protein